MSVVLTVVTNGWLVVVFLFSSHGEPPKKGKGSRGSFKLLH